jgi:ketosteroid isomerase-like protein
VTWLKAVFVSVAFTFCVAIAAGQKIDRPQYCTAIENRKFDFWLGDWDAYESATETVSARVKVASVLNGCGLQEEYTGKDGLIGKSISMFDSSRQIWIQDWVTDRGQYLHLEGRFENHSLRLETPAQPGTPERVRGVWKPIAGGVRETAWRSHDGGNTWEGWFDLVFKPHIPTQTESNVTDEEVVAELDRQYQAAVERNDADAMAAILGDDFLIVTGSGKRFTKRDLLEEARSKKYLYDKQIDTDKTVRVYADIAIVTAKLYAKGTEQGREFEYSLWFTDIYRKTADGWKYVYAQSSIPLPKIH